MRTDITYRIVLFIFLSGLFRLAAQDISVPENADQKSLRLYNEKKWNDLISYGKNAIRNGDNYYYMQMRVGIAYYEKKNYSLAQNYFKQAIKLNSTEELPKEYLYYCYLFNGRFEDALKLSKTFSDSLLSKTGTNKETSLTGLIIEAGSKTSDSVSYYDKNQRKETNYFNPAVYFQIGLGHHIKKRLSFLHAFTFFNQQTFVGTTRQIQYYLRSSIPVKNNWLLSPAFHLVNQAFSTDLSPPPPKQGMGPPPRRNTTVSTTVSNYFVGSFTVQKVVGKCNFSLGSAVSNMFNKTQYLHTGSASYSFFGNTWLIAGCTAYIHTTDNYTTTYTSAIPFLYTQPLKRLSINASYLYNKGNNIVEDNGYFVNNSADLTNSRWSVMANILISKHLTVYGLYQLEDKTEAVQQFKYKYNILAGGIKITP